jgi:ABC-2 type transport system permease protein
MSTTFTIAKREFRSSFDSPLAYVVICLGLVMLGIFFFFVNDFWQGDQATLTPMFAMAPRGLSLVIVPVLTMRLLAEEKRSGTLEMLITLPVRDHEVILGKFLGAWSLVLALIASTALYPAMMFTGIGYRSATLYFWKLGVLDTGPVFSGYLGLVLYSAAAVSLGLLISALTDSQVIAFFVTWTLLVILSFLGYSNNIVGPGTLRNMISFIGFDTRLASFAKGQIITRDIVYFLSITVGCLMAAFRALERRKWA